MNSGFCAWPLSAGVNRHAEWPEDPDSFRQITKQIFYKNQSGRNKDPGQQKTRSGSVEKKPDLVVSKKAKKAAKQTAEFVLKAAAAALIEALINQMFR